MHICKKYRIFAADFKLAYYAKNDFNSVFESRSICRIACRRCALFDYKNNKDWKFKGDKPCVIDFYTTWCGPCKRLAPIMEELSQTYCDQVVFYKVDTERERELAYLFGINSIPQVLYIPMEGKSMLLQGLYPKENIVQIIDEFLLKKD